MTHDLAKGERFEAQVSSQLEDLYNIAFFVLGSESAAQYLVHETLARAYQTRLSGQTGSDCRVWLFRVMASVLIGERRSFGTTQRLEPALSTPKEALRRPGRRISHYLVTLINVLFPRYRKTILDKSSRTCPIIAGWLWSSSCSGAFRTKR